MGGKAFKDVTRRILRSEIIPTLEWLEEQWPDYVLNGTIHISNFLLGSAGKNEDSGDLDLNLDIKKYDQALVANQLEAFLGADYVKARPGNNQIFTAVPIKGDPANGYVQVDFMFGDRAWQSFSYFAAGISDKPDGIWQPKHSRFKGLYRTEFLKALTAYNSDWVLEENGEMIARVGPTFFHDKGLVWRYRYRPFKRGSTSERIKTLKEVDKDEFLSIFPSAIPAKTDVMLDPEEVTKLLFEDHIDAESCTTLESCWTFTTWYYKPEERAKIIKIYVERLNSLKAEIPVSLFKSIGIKVEECAGTKS